LNRSHIVVTPYLSSQANDISRDEIFRRASGCTIIYHKRSEENLEELKIEPFEEKLKRYKSNWQQHVTRTNNRMPEIILNCRQNGRRRLGRPLKRLFDEAETGLSRPNARRMMIVQRSTTWPAWT